MASSDISFVWQASTDHDLSEAAGKKVEASTSHAVDTAVEPFHAVLNTGNEGSQGPHLDHTHFASARADITSWRDEFRNNLRGNSDSVFSSSLASAFPFFTGNVNLGDHDDLNTIQADGDSTAYREALRIFNLFDTLSAATPKRSVKWGTHKAVCEVVRDRSRTVDYGQFWCMCVTEVRAPVEDVLEEIWSVDSNVMRGSAEVKVLKRENNDVIFTVATNMTTQRLNASWQRVKCAPSSKAKAYVLVITCTCTTTNLTGLPSRGYGNQADNGQTKVAFADYKQPYDAPKIWSAWLLEDLGEGAFGL